ncbi:MAG TPA: CaiB/BaiF CoA-transferase family protein [Thermodesulfobacteriota bacterium]|nr:CaiB/BaiF CoA-transferase family protein [Thermodesulfobacteriota bacterium]
MPQALGDIKVLDLSRVLAMPYCSMMLGDLGAEVIRVERPGIGDETRHWGPPWLGKLSAYYLCTNRNKKCITVDLKKKEGQEIVRNLAARSDILLENFLPGALAEMGLGYEQIREVNPRIIYASVTGYGQNGPYRDFPGFDFIIQAQGGIMSITGEGDGQPTKVGVAIVDITAGLFASSAILAALHYREKTGLGQRIDIALLDSQVAWLANQASNYLVSGKVPRRMGNAHPNIVPYETFRAKDGIYIALGVGNDNQWRKFCRLAGLDDLAEDPRYATNPKRVENRKELGSILRNVFLRKNSDEWVRDLTAAEIPAGPINTVDRVVSDPQVLAREMVVAMEHPEAGAMKVIGSPMKLSETPVEYRIPPPMLGEHTEEILKRIHGYDQSTVARLKEEKVV